MTSTSVSCPVCSSAAPQMCAYNNHTNKHSPVFWLKNFAARIGWRLLGFTPTTTASSMGRITKKFSAGVFKFHKIHRCGSCELGFVQPAIKPAHLRRYYSQAYWQDSRFEPEMDIHIDVASHEAPRNIIWSPLM